MNKSVTKGFIYGFLVIIVCAISCHSAIAGKQKEQTMQSSEKHVFTNAQDFIEYFRKGGGSHRKRESFPCLLTGNRRVIKYSGL